MNLVGTSEDNEEQIQRMLLYIIQDGAEKAEEIEVKGEEDFNAERYNQIYKAIMQIEANYKTKEIKLERDTKIFKCRSKNDYKLKFLKRKYDQLTEAFEEAKRRLSQLDRPENADLYRHIQKALTVQALCTMGEKRVKIRTRMKDAALMADLLPSVLEEYLEITGGEAGDPLDTTSRTVPKVEVDRRKSLKEDCGGGLLLTNGSNTVALDNTLNTRLQTLQANSLPLFVKLLFETDEGATR